MRLLKSLCLAGLLLQAGAAAAADTRTAVVTAAREFLVPRYAALAEATGRQASRWRDFCASPQPQGMKQLRAAFHEAADTWSGIEFVRYGPIAQDNRFERMAHWPERQNAVSRALTNLLARTGVDDLEPERFDRTSAAAQGLTALERLLFDGIDGALSSEPDIRRWTGSPAATRRCAVGQAIAAGLAARAKSVLDEWRGSGGPLDRLANAEDETIREAATRLGTELLSFFEFIADQKLGAPMGKDIDSARPTLAEAWRSERSLRAIRTNLQGIADLTRLLVDEAAEEGRSALIAIEVARSIAAELSGSVGELAADRRRRRDLVLLRDALQGPRELVGIALTSALGITIGFNSRDGD